MKNIPQLIKIKLVVVVLLFFCLFGCNKETSVSDLEDTIFEEYNIDVKADLIEKANEDTKLDITIIKNGFCLNESFNDIFSNILYYHLNKLGYSEVKLILRYPDIENECSSENLVNEYYFMSKDLNFKNISLYQYCLKNFDGFDYYTMESSFLKALNTVKEYEKLREYVEINSFFDCLNKFTEEIDDRYSGAKILFSTIYIFYAQTDDKDLKRLPIHIEELWKLAKQDENIDVDNLVKESIMEAYKKE